MSVTSLLAAIPTNRRYLAAILYFSLSAPIPHVWAEPGQKRPDFLVKIIIESRVAIFDARTMTSAIRIQQRTPFTGLIIDDKGHVVSFIGMRWWPDVGVGRTKAVIETQDGRRLPAEFVGIDQRISLAVFEARTVKVKFQGFRSFPESGQLRFLTLGREEWRGATPFLVKGGRHPLLSEKEGGGGGGRRCARAGGGG